MQLSNYIGCILGGGIGDALGAEIEFLTLTQIYNQYGKEGISKYPTNDEKGYITDDTQMTLFTLEGLLRYQGKLGQRGIANPIELVYRAYLRWLVTQNEPIPFFDEQIFETGWLIQQESLYHRRAPGITCLSALQKGKMGSIRQPINQSKGCGGIMRVAPVGLFRWKNAEEAFGRGAEIAAITHGHPSGYLAAGFFAMMLFELKEGKNLLESITNSLAYLKRMPQHQETSLAVEKALHLANEGEASTEKLEQLGEGWVAEEALAMSLYTVLKFPNDFKSAVLFAIHHSGDSDSTGAIVGNILGFILGQDALPEPWVRKLAHKKLLIEMATDLWKGYPKEEKEQRAFEKKYPLY